MATGNANKAYSSTIAAASTAETATLNHAPAWVTIVNRDGTNGIWYRLDGTAPTVAGADCFYLPPNQSATRANPQIDQNTCAVGLISTATPAYTVQVADSNAPDV